MRVYNTTKKRSSCRRSDSGIVSTGLDSRSNTGQNSGIVRQTFDAVFLLIPDSADTVSHQEIAYNKGILLEHVGSCSSAMT